jgi:hypothetical protein
MDTTTIAILVLAALAVLLVGGLLGFMFAGRRRTQNLQERFGPEYERAVEDLGSRGEAEAALQSRIKHVDSLDLKPIPAEERARFVKEWQQAQAMFVDQPEQAVREADHLVKEVMIAKGYPAEDFDHRLADLSVDYPETTASYRLVKDIKRDGGPNGRSTEEMRQAMVLCKGLFEDLLDARVKKAAHR